MTKKKKGYWYAYSTYQKDEQKDDAGGNQIQLYVKNVLVTSMIFQL
jgi:hypothetical protein